MNQMDAKNAVRSALQTKATFWRRVTWSIAGVTMTSIALASLLGWTSLDSHLIIVLGALFSLAFIAAFLVASRSRSRLQRFISAERDIATAIGSISSVDIRNIVHDLRRSAETDPAIRDLYAASSPQISHHLERVLEVEVRNERSRRVRELCENARTIVRQQIELQRSESPAIKAERTISGAIENLVKLKADAEKRLDEERESRRLKWWFDLTRPDFEEVEEKIEELRRARQKLIASGDIAKTESYFRDLSDRVERRTRDIQKDAIASIPARPHDKFDDQRVVQGALMLSALSVPISAWGDISQAGNVFDSLRAVNGNYADMTDTEIWFDTLTMAGPELAGLANLTKGALFEAHVESSFGGELHEHFNHPDTDIVIDGVAYQIKATDSASYIDTVADGIPVISTTEVASITGSLDGGYSNEDLTDTVYLALGGTVLDISDTALDAVLTGVGGVGIFAILSGVRSASAKYKETGDALESLAEGLSTATVHTARTTVNMAEMATKGVVGVATSRPVRFAGNMVASMATKAAARFDRWLEDEAPTGLAEGSLASPQKTPRGSR
ncbi:hypothetical protein [Erythrobacter sp. MTPC3]|uniref:hypothetical protein n=1 Tax=Erythrobacter sp. MTPC3 TaxID=3056564 RepID=UPI0036F4151B